MFGKVTLKWKRVQFFYSQWTNKEPRLSYCGYCWSWLQRDTKHRTTRPLCGSRASSSSHETYSIATVHDCYCAIEIRWSMYYLSILWVPLLIVIDITKWPVWQNRRVCTTARISWLYAVYGNWDLCSMRFNLKLISQRCTSCWHFCSA